MHSPVQPSPVRPSLALTRSMLSCMSACLPELRVTRKRQGSWHTINHAPKMLVGDSFTMGPEFVA